MHFLFYKAVLYLVRDITNYNKKFICRKKIAYSKSTAYSIIMQATLPAALSTVREMNILLDAAVVYSNYYDSISPLIILLLAISHLSQKTLSSHGLLL